MIATKTKQSYDKSKETAGNLIKDYSPNSLATDTRFSIVTGGKSQPSVVGGDQSNSKIEILELVSKLKYSVDNPDELIRSLEFIKSKVYGSCTLDAKCNTGDSNDNGKPRKVLMLLVDRKLEEGGVPQRLTKELSDSGVNVIVAVASGSIEPDSPVVVVTQVDGGNDGDGDSDEDGVKVLVYPSTTDSSTDGGSGDDTRGLTPAIVKLIKKGKWINSL